MSQDNDSDLEGESSPKWVVVEFVGLECCEVISTDWLIGEEECYWPDFLEKEKNCKLEQAIRRHRRVKLDEEDWSRRAVVILGGSEFSKSSELLRFFIMRGQLETIGFRLPKIRLSQPFRFIIILLHPLFHQIVVFLDLSAF